MRALPPPLETMLDRLAESDEVCPIDLALARLLAAHDLADTAEAAAAPGNAGLPPERLARARSVAMAAALVSARRADGHSLVALEEWAGLPFPGHDDEPRLLLPDAAAWRAALEASPVAGPPEAALPLVLTDAGTLALARLHHAEARVATAVSRRLRAPEEAAPAPEIGRTFASLFPPRPDGAPDWQAVAVAAALSGRLTLVAGGPGTGKTHTATRLLALLLAQTPTLRVALAAPTGKAARRLSESLAQGRARLPPELAAPVPTEATTLHRLLGYVPDRGFRHDARNPLPHDLVLVDEGSMIDLPLFDALLEAITDDARLVVLGDPDQLPSVEAGAVFGDLCRAGGTAPNARLRRACAPFALALPEAPPPSPDEGPLAGAVVTLTQSRRFDAASDVGALARAFRAGDAGAVRAVLADPARPGAALASEREAVAWMLPHARDIVRAASPEEALGLLGRQGLLAALRRGPRGVEGLGQALEQALRAEGLIPPAPWRSGEPFYDGRPLLVTANDDALGLANGDIGVCWRSGAERVVCFPPETPGTPVRRIPHARLRATESAWALTIHKSQGSEYDRVGVVLPAPGEAGAELVSRELLYTAVTRARMAVTLFGEATAAAAAAARPTLRRSGLGAMLRQAAAASAA